MFCFFSPSTCEFPQGDIDHHTFWAPRGAFAENPRCPKKRKKRTPWGNFAQGLFLVGKIAPIPWRISRGVIFRRNFLALRGIVKGYYRKIGTTTSHGDTVGCAVSFDGEPCYEIATSARASRWLFLLNHPHKCERTLVKTGIQLHSNPNTHCDPGGCTRKVTP